MRVLVACEFSGTVRDAFRARGHDAMSCDLLDTESPGPHYRGDVRDVLNDGWDLMIAHPPCTYLAVSGLHWNTRRPSRAALTERAIEFVRELWAAPIPRKALENPVGILSTRFAKPSQIIQPNEYGHDASKKTCLWLEGLPLLRPTARVLGLYACRCGGPRFARELGAYGCPNCEGGRGRARLVWANQTASGQNRLPPSPDRWKLRSITYPGIAAAFAEQWGTAPAQLSLADAVSHA